MIDLIREFRPALLFLGKFLAFYLVGNLIYGLYVNSYRPGPDPLTNWVTCQTSLILRGLGYPNEISDHPRKPTTIVTYQGRAIISVYEGCSGLNVIIIFAGFVISFGPWIRSVRWFIPLGIFIIHITNLMRIVLLFFVSIYYPRHLYVIHKYVFTGIIYAVVLLLWIVWVKYFSMKPQRI